MGDGHIVTKISLSESICFFRVVSLTPSQSLLRKVLISDAS